MVSPAVAPSVPYDVARYAAELTDRLASATSAPVAAAVLIGSVALGEYRAGTSDIDVLVVLDHAIGPDQRSRIVQAVSHPALACPARGLELQIYDRTAVSEARADGAFLVNLNTGPAMATSVTFDPATEPAHWFVIDRAIAHRHSVVVQGAPTAELVAAGSTKLS